MKRSYKIPQMKSTTLTVHKTVTGETMEQKMVRILTNGEPVEDPNVSKTYTERKHGVPAQFDIRTDIRVLAQEAMAIAGESYVNKRNDRIEESEKGAEAPTDGGGESEA